MKKSIGIVIIALLFATNSDAQRLYFLLGPNKDTVSNSDNKVLVFLQTKDGDLVRYNKGNKLALPNIPIGDVYSLVLVHRRDTFSMFDNRINLKNAEKWAKIAVGTEAEKDAADTYARTKRNAVTELAYLHRLIASGENMVVTYELENNGIYSSTGISYGGNISHCTHPINNNRWEKPGQEIFGFN